MSLWLRRGGGEVRSVRGQKSNLSTRARAADREYCWWVLMRLSANTAYMLMDLVP